MTPPVGTPNGADVTLTMLVERSEDGNNELIFTFGPHGSQFNPPVEITFNWEDLGSDTAILYYIDDNGNFIQQEPDQIDVQGKRMTLFLDHFSRYAIGPNSKSSSLLALSWTTVMVRVTFCPESSAGGVSAP